MPKLFECPGYTQTEEKGASLSARDSCLRCGRTKAAHLIEARPSHEIATDWLIEKGLKDNPYFELVRNVLTHYIEDNK